MENINMSDVFSVVFFATFCGNGLYSILDDFWSRLKRKKEAGK